MSEIETTEESQACRAAMERLAEAGWSLENEDDNLALIRMWVHGRDWARAQGAVDATVTAAAKRLVARHQEADGLGWCVACGGYVPCDIVLVARALLDGRQGGGGQGE